MYLKIKTQFKLTQAYFLNTKGNTKETHERNVLLLCDNLSSSLNSLITWIKSPTNKLYLKWSSEKNTLIRFMQPPRGIFSAEKSKHMGVFFFVFFLLAKLMDADYTNAGMIMTTTAYVCHNSSAWCHGCCSFVLRSGFKASEYQHHPAKSYTYSSS